MAIHSYLSEPAASDDDQNPSEYVWRIPSRYGDPTESGLKAEVVSGNRPLEFAFEVTE